MMKKISNSYAFWFTVVVLFTFFYNGFSALEFNGSYKISPKPCSVEGETTSDKRLFGTCMFVWECLKTNGKHLGMCVDGFMFGSCCKHNESDNSVFSSETNQGNSNTLSAIDSIIDSVSSSGEDNIEKETTEVPFVSLFPSTTPNLGSSSLGFSDESENDIRPSSSTNVNDIFAYQVGSPGTGGTKVKPVLVLSEASSNHEGGLDKPGSDIDCGEDCLETQLPFVTKNSTMPFDALFNSGTEVGETSSEENSVTESSTSPKPIGTTETVSSQKPTLSTTTMGHPKPQLPIGMTFINPMTSTTQTPTSPIKNYKGCGLSQMLPQKRIVGGKEASLGQFPWQVSVRRTSFFGFSSTHRCGGALINEQWIATAGHCVDDLMTSQIKIRLGEHDFTKNPTTNPHVERGVTKKVVHPKYNFFTYENDLALIKLEKPVSLSSHIIPICLPGNGDLLIGEKATVTGWGRLSEGGKLPNKLHHVQVPIISNDKCREMFLKSGRMEYIPEIFLCAGYDNGGRDSCQGDSGGPLQVKGADNRYFLAGIISWGIGCAEPSMPGVCTRISKFTSWILNVVKTS